MFWAEHYWIALPAFERFLDRLAEAKKWKHKVHYGDVTDPAMMGALAISHARVVVVTTREYSAVKQITGTLRQFYPSVKVITAVPYLFQRDELRQMGAAQVVRRSYRPKNVVVAAYQPGGWRVAPLTAPEQIRPGLMVYRFTHSMYYANADQLLREVEDLASGTQPTLSWFCIEASAVADVDFTAAAALRSIHDMLKEKGVRLVFADVLDDTVRAEMDRFGLTDLIGKDAFYPTLREVVDAYDWQVTRSGPKGTPG